MDTRNSTSEAEQKKQITETLDRWAAAIREADTAAIADLTSKEAVFWTHGAPEIKGREALVNSFKPFFNQYSMEQAFRPDEIIVSGDFAFVRGTEINRLTSRPDSAETVVRQRAFSLLRKEQDGAWRFYRGMTNLPPED